MAFLLADESQVKIAVSAGLVAVCVAAAALGYSKKKAKLPLPPGPPGLPLIGNTFDIPAENFWLKYMEWSNQYGSDVISLNILGTPIIILNSLASCKELLERRSSIYSSRPNMPMMNDLIGFDWHFGFMPYNEEWKERRKIFQAALHPTKTDKYRPQLLTAIRVFLLQVLDDPENTLGHARMLAGAFILDVSYGIDVRSKDERYIVQAERAMAAMAAAGTASSYMVDFVPSLKLLPSWIPGVKFKREASEWRHDVKAMPRDCLQFAEDSLIRGDGRLNIAAQLLQSLSNGEYLSDKKRSAIHDTLGSIYAAGSDTVVSSFSTFLLAMVQNPEIQKKAQQIIDQATSDSDRLPDFTEYRTLPYIEALVREVLRWRPVTPIAVPHMVTQDDIYKGYHIPAGSTVIPNIWAVSHDPALYGPNPSVFDPSRFMNEAQTEIKPDMPLGQETFGYGRRICPGLQVAVETVWMFTISVLATFDIRPDGDGKGEADRDFGKYASGLLIHPYPFKFRITPRSREAESLIRNGVLVEV